MNRIGIIGHRGWVAGHVLKALVVSGAPLKVIHRPGSDTSGLPAHIRTVEVSLDNEDALVHALQDVDIVMSVQFAHEPPCGCRH
jgi:nucleoside-diphosphate-sugar epimerase